MQSHVVWHGAVPYRQDPTVFPPKNCRCARTCQKTNCCRCFSSDSRAHKPCAITKREAVTMITAVRDGERSLSLLPQNFCEVQHVPRNDTVHFCQTLGILSGEFLCCSQQSFSSPCMLNTFKSLPCPVRAPVSGNRTILQLQPSFLF